MGPNPQSRTHATELLVTLLVIGGHPAGVIG